MLKGSKHSEKTKRKIKEHHNGKHFSPKTEFKKGHKPYWRIDYSEKWRKKVSKGWFKKGIISFVHCEREFGYTR